MEIQFWKILKRKQNPFQTVGCSQMGRKKNQVISEREFKTWKCSWKLSYRKRHFLLWHGTSKGILKIADAFPMLAWAGEETRLTAWK